MKLFRAILMPVLAVVITCGVLWFENRQTETPSATWDDVLREAQNGGYHIINTGQLWDLYQQPSKNAVIVDTRQEWEFRTGHIKDAINFPIEPTWLDRWRKRAALKEILGPDKQRPTVFY